MFFFLPHFKVVNHVYSENYYHNDVKGNFKVLLFFYKFLVFNSFHLTIISFFLSLFFAGSSTPVRHISLRSLLPNTDQYMTYEGSTTHPGCWESTVWIILNKPIYITRQEVSRNFSFYGYVVLSRAIIRV